MYYIIILRYQYNKTFFLYVCHIATLLCLQWVTLQWKGYVHQIMTTRLCSSHCDVKIFSSHFNVMMFVTSQHPFFITLRPKGYVHDIATSVYVCHIMMIGICSSHCDNKVIIITLWHLYMFITFQHYYFHQITMWLFC